MAVSSQYNKIYKPQEMTGVSVCFIKLVLLSPLRSRCRGGVSGSPWATYGLSGGFHERPNQGDKCDVAAA